MYFYNNPGNTNTQDNSYSAVIVTKSLRQFTRFMLEQHWVTADLRPSQSVWARSPHMGTIIILKAKYLFFHPSHRPSELFSEFVLSTNMNVINSMKPFLHMPLMCLHFRLSGYSRVLTVFSITRILLRCIFG